MNDKPSITCADDDRITWLRLRSVALQLANPISDAKVLTGRQKPMTEIAILIAEIATGEMLTSPAEHWEFIRQRGADFFIPDAPRVGGARADPGRTGRHQPGATLRHGAARTPGGEPRARALGRALRVAGGAVQRASGIRDGRMLMPTRPGLGMSRSEQVAGWAVQQAEVGTRG